MTKLTEAQHTRFRKIMKASGHTDEHLTQANYPDEVILSVLGAHIHDCI
ncbi:MAG: hypothetical protein KAJ03_07315 [Gammaproteobacteria bacterium]|nr:hypothetical protein [Gammaproteobacteria bacterium]